jgi:hypothetical protein
VARLFVALICVVTIPRVLAAQADTARADTGAIAIKLGIPHPPLVLQEPGVLRAPWLGAPRLPGRLWQQAWDSTIQVVLDSTRQERAAALRLMALYGVPVQAEPSPDRGDPSRRGVLGLSRKYADLGLDGQVRLELRTDRLRNERCTPAQLLDPNSVAGEDSSPRGWITR